MIRLDLRVLINKHKPMERLNNNTDKNNNTNNNTDTNNINNDTDLENGKLC